MRRSGQLQYQGPVTAVDQDLRAILGRGATDRAEAEAPRAAV